MTIFARNNSDGVSVNESGVCYTCLHDTLSGGEAEDLSYEYWSSAEDVDPEKDDESFHPCDNPDARCLMCGRVDDSWTWEEFHRITTKKE